MTMPQVEFFKTWANRPDPERRPRAFPDWVSETPENTEKVREHIANANFMMRHWIPNVEVVRQHDFADDEVAFNCPFFNTNTRLCEAYEKRPPICSGYPWYDQDPEEMVRHEEHRPPVECSYWVDVPLRLRPKGWKATP
jgi:Fe-S-cluster containining protein